MRKRINSCAAEENEAQVHATEKIRLPHNLSLLNLINVLISYLLSCITPNSAIDPRAACKYQDKLGPVPAPPTVETMTYELM